MVPLSYFRARHSNLAFTCMIKYLAKGIKLWLFNKSVRERLRTTIREITALVITVVLRQALKTSVLNSSVSLIA